jgi:hypothetical protein
VEYDFFFVAHNLITNLGSQKGGFSNATHWQRMVEDA